jgi:hypothetical protein
LGEGFDKLHDWGDSLGPGYGDILTGLAGFGLLLGGVKLGRRARRSYEKSLESRSARGDKRATYAFNQMKERRAQNAGDADGAKGYRAENKIIDREGDNVVEAGRKVSYEDPNKPGKRLETDIDVETKTEVIQVKAGTKMPSPNQTGATRMRAQETGKAPKVIYDQNTMPKGAVKKFQKDNPDFVLEGTDLT